MPGRCAAGAGENHLKTFALGVLGEGDEPAGRAMRRNDSRLIADVERLQGLGRVAHRRPVGLRTHDDGDGFRLFGHNVSLPLT